MQAVADVQIDVVAPRRIGRQPVFKRSDMTNAIHEVRGHMHRTPTVRGYTAYKAGDPTLPSVDTIIGQFGSWNSAMKACGLIPNGDRARWRAINYRR